MSENGSSRLPTEFLAERDARVFALRKTGLSAADIARRMDLSVAQVTGAIDRQLKKLNREAYQAYPEVLRLELERLDQLQASFWPKTQMRRTELEDGTEVVLEPDEKAAATVMAIMDRRHKLLGMETAANVAVQEAQRIDAIDVRSTLEGANVGAKTAEELKMDEAKELLRLAQETGIFPADVVAPMLGSGEDSSIVNAEIVVDTSTDSE